jgi:hypothetical protein
MTEERKSKNSVIDQIGVVITSLQIIAVTSSREDAMRLDSCRKVLRDVIDILLVDWRPE